MNGNVMARNDHTMTQNEPHMVQATLMDEMVAERTDTNNSLAESR